MINRVLVVGAGSIGRRHAKIVRRLSPTVEIRFYRPSGNTEVPNFANSNCFDFDAVTQFKPHVSIICTPAPFHVEVAIKLAQLGSHLLIEKPISNSLKGIPHLVEAVEKSMITCWVGYNLRFNKALVELKRNLVEGTIGDILFFDASVGQFLPEWRPLSDYRETVSARHALGGGALLELSHEFDYLNWLFGCPKWVSATIDKVSSLDIDVEDMAKLILSFRPNSTGHEIYGSVNLDFARQDPIRRCSVVGNKGTLIWDGVSNTLEFFCGKNKRLINLFSAPLNLDDSYQDQWKSFCAAISNDLTLGCTITEAANVIKMINAIKQSSENESKRVYF